MSNQESFTNPNKKISKKLPVYIILATALFGLIGSLYIITTEPQKEERIAEEQTVKETQLLQAETGDEASAKRIVDKQILEANKELEDKQKQSEKAFKAFNSKQDTEIKVHEAPPLSMSLPGTPPPPRKQAALQVFDKEMSNATRATTSPEIFDFSQPSTTIISAPQTHGTVGANEVLVAEGSTEEAPTLDERWRSPASPVQGTLKAPSEYLLQEGSIIDVVLMNNLNTQNPGRIQFRVVSNVYDSLGNRHLLIPQGTKLMGRYGQPPSFGLDRVPISINRAVFANGRSINLSDTDISDAMGVIGAPAEFHSNIWRAIGPAALVAWIGFKMDEAIAAETPANTNNTATTATQTISQSTVPEIQKRILQRYGSAQPYYTENAGKRLSIIVASDIAIPPEH